MQKLIALLALAGLAGGCAGISALPVSSSSLISSPAGANLEIHNQTGVQLQQANFVIVKTNLTAEAKGFSLLGLLTIVPARFGKAMNQLYTRAELETGKSQTLAHVVMEKTSLYFILFAIPRVSVHADVVEFIPETAVLIPHPILPPLSPPEGKTSAAAP